MCVCVRLYVYPEAAPTLLVPLLTEEVSKRCGGGGSWRKKRMAERQVHSPKENGEERKPRFRLLFSVGTPQQLSSVVSAVLRSLLQSPLPHYLCPCCSSESSFEVFAAAPFSFPVPHSGRVMCRTEMSRTFLFFLFAPPPYCSITQYYDCAA